MRTLGSEPKRGDASNLGRVAATGWILGLSLLLLSPRGLPATVTLESLLDEMTDRDQLARWPRPSYLSLQASSCNRASTHREQADRGTSGWFADSDGVGFLRTEEQGGRTEWVVMEHEGPGCITRIWTPYFYHDLNNRVGPNVRVGGLNQDTRGYNTCSRTRVLDAIAVARRLVFNMESSFGVDIRHPWDLVGYTVLTYWHARPGAVHNRPPHREAASRPLLGLAEARRRSAAIRAEVGKTRR